MLMLIVDLLYERVHCRVICSCIHKSDIYIHIGEDWIFISILAMTQILCIHIGDENDTDVYLEVTTLVMTGTTCI